MDVKRTPSFPNQNAKKLSPSPLLCDGSDTIQGEPTLKDEESSSYDEESSVNRTESVAASWRSWKLRTKAAINLKKSSKGKHWKPITLRAPVLGSFIVVSVFLIIILEVLARIAGVASNFGGSGAIAYANSDGNLSTSISFAYLYFPTVIAVCYSMFWSWVELDSKRLEPWFQLSQESGASADDSLLLHYNFDFLAVVPIRAARRKHWSVFFAGITMMIIFWAVTPLQSAIFGTGSIVRKQAAQMATTAAIQSFASQSDTLNANFLMTAYGISWLGEKVPAFTTKSYAVLPFAPIQGESKSLPTETWSTTAEAYSANLNCTAAKSIFQENETQYTFDNGKGCIVPNISLPQGSNDILIYMGYYNDAHIDWSLANPNCTLEFANNFLAIWARGASETAGGHFGNMAALFCETSYAVQNITVQVNGSDHSILSDNFGSTESQALPANIINITNFEYIIGSGFSPITQLTDYPNTILVEQYPRLVDYNLTWPTTNMVGYGVAAASAPSDRLGDPAVLESAFLKAHQLLFSIAVNKLIDGSSRSVVQNLRDGQLEDQITAIIFVRPFSVIVEAFLLLICFMTAGLWYTMARRDSQLVGDPNSIGAYMSMVAGCNGLKDLFRDMGTVTREELDARLRLRRFKLRGTPDSKPPSMHLEVLSSGNATNIGRSITDQSISRKSEYFISPIRPVELRLFAACFFIGTLVSSIIVFTYLNQYMAESNGLQLPSSSAIVRQILEHYMPTILATVLEPFWIVLNRLLCILKPFDELRRGGAAPSRSIDIKYSSLPPPLVFGRALKSRHFLLAAVCAVSSLANVLAISLSGLFKEAPTTNIQGMSSTYEIGMTIQNGSAFTYYVGEVPWSDHFYATLANASAGTSLPPWVSTDFFFTPFNFNSTSSDARFMATTRGFGVETACEHVTQSATVDRVIFEEADNGTSAQFSILHTGANGTVLTCVLASGEDGTTIGQQPPSSNASAFEVVSAMDPLGKISGIDDSLECERLLVTGWARLGPSRVQDQSNSTNTTISNRSFDAIFLACQPTLRTALFNVTVDSTGRVLSSQQQTPFDTDLQPFFKGTTAYDLSHPVEFMENQTKVLYSKTNEYIAQGEQRVMQWHTTPISFGWVNYLLRFRTNSTALISPTSPLPSPETVIPAMESFYRQMFATLLGLNKQVFSPLDPAMTVTVTIAIPETRLYMSQTMFLITFTILAINIIVAVLYYYKQPKRFLPMMPTTIASIVGLVVATRALKDYSWDKHDSDSSDRSTESKEREKLRYGYGRFVSTDGVTRIGIERHPWVIPMESKNPEVRKRTWTFGKNDEKQPKSWI